MQGADLFKPTCFLSKASVSKSIYGAGGGRGKPSASTYTHAFTGRSTSIMWSCTGPGISKGSAHASWDYIFPPLGTISPTPKKTYIIKVTIMTLNRRLTVGWSLCRGSVCAMICSVIVRVAQGGLPSRALVRVAQGGLPSRALWNSCRLNVWRDAAPTKLLAAPCPQAEEL